MSGTDKWTASWQDPVEGDAEHLARPVDPVRHPDQHAPGEHGHCPLQHVLLELGLKYTHRTRARGIRREQRAGALRSEGVPPARSGEGCRDERALLQRTAGPERRVPVPITYRG